MYCDCCDRSDITGFRGVCGDSVAGYDNHYCNGFYGSDGSASIWLARYSIVFCMLSWDWCSWFQGSHSWCWRWSIPYLFWVRHPTLPGSPPKLPLSCWSMTLTPRDGKIVQTIQCTLEFQLGPAWVSTVWCLRRCLLSCSCFMSIAVFCCCCCFWLFCYWCLIHPLPMWSRSWTW